MNGATSQREREKTHAYRLHASTFMCFTFKWMQNIRAQYTQYTYTLCGPVLRSLVYVLVYSNWNVQAIKTNEVNYYCVCFQLYSFRYTSFSPVSVAVCVCAAVFVMFRFFQRLVFSPLVQTTCLFRDVHYSPLDDVYRVLPKHKLSRHDETKGKTATLKQIEKEIQSSTLYICSIYVHNVSFICIASYLKKIWCISYRPTHNDVFVIIIWMSLARLICNILWSFHNGLSTKTVN